MNNDKIHKKEELNNFIQRVHEIYQNNSVVSIYNNKVTLVFDNVALSAIEQNDFKTIAMLEEQYPEFRTYIFYEYRSYKSTHHETKQKMKKYKKRYKILTAISVLLLLTTILSCTLLWSHM